MNKGYFILSLLLMTPAFATQDHERATALFKQGKYQEAVTLLDELIQVHPNWDYPLVLHGRCMVKLKKHTAALDDFQTVLDLDIKPGAKNTARYFMATTFMEMKEYNRALVLLEQLTTGASGKRLFSLKLNIGQCYMAQAAAAKNSTAVEVYGKAAKAFDDALRADPTNRQASAAGFQRGYAFYQQGDLDRAMASCRQTLQQHPKHQRSAKFLVDLHFHQVAQNKDQAVALYQEAADAIDTYVAAFGETEDMLFRKGQALQGAKQYKKAIAALQQALTLNHNNGESHFTLASCRMMAGQHKQAFGDFQTALKLNHDGNGKLYGYAARCALKGKSGCTTTDIPLYEQAVTLLEQGFNKRPNDQTLAADLKRTRDNLNILQENKQVDRRNHEATLANIQMLNQRVGASLKSLQRKRQLMADEAALKSSLTGEVDQLVAGIKEDKASLEREYKLLANYITAIDSCGEATTYPYYNTMKKHLQARTEDNSMGPAHSR